MSKPEDGREDVGGLWIPADCEFLGAIVVYVDRFGAEGCNFFDSPLSQQMVIDSGTLLKLVIELDKRDRKSQKES